MSRNWHETESSFSFRGKEGNGAIRDRLPHLRPSLRLARKLGKEIPREAFPTVLKVDKDDAE